MGEGIGIVISFACMMLDDIMVGLECQAPLCTSCIVVHELVEPSKCTVVRLDRKGASQQIDANSFSMFK